MNPAEFPEHQRVVRVHWRGSLRRVVDTFFRFLCGPDVQRQYHEAIYHLTIRDFSTGLYNRRYLEEALERELMRATRKATRLAVTMLLWEPRPDVVSHDLLRKIADIVHETLPRDWFAARSGELELVVVAPETSGEELEHGVRRWLQGCPESAAPNMLGIAEADGGSLDSVPLIALAKANAVRQSGLAPR